MSPDDFAWHGENRFMKIRKMLVAAGLAVFAVVAFVGCGTNSCQDLSDAITAATAKDGCDAAIGAYTAPFSQINPTKCNASDTEDTEYEAATICFNAVKSCKTSTGLSTLADCLIKAESAK
jgi:hypothetical protein